MANLIGPDVSFYQDAETTPQGINFVKMKQLAGYVIIRAGQNVWIDSDFKTNWRNAKAAELPRGSYWFYDSRAEPKEQAELWISALEGDFGELPLFADFEEAYGGPYTGWKHWKTFLDRLDALNGNREIGIYTAYYYWVRHAPNATSEASSLQYFKRFPLWIANYGVTTPLVPKPWNTNEWTFWQFTDSGDGDQYGVESSRIDLNYFNGDAAAFAQRFKTSTPTDPPPVDTGWYKVVASALNVREGPGTNFAPLGLLKRDDVVERLASSTDGAWVQVKRHSDNLTGWCSLQYLVATPAPTTPPPPPPPPPVGDWYKVNVAALNVREDAGTNFAVVGVVHQDDVLMRLATSTDGEWFQVKRYPDNLSGWCAKQYLVITSAPTTQPPPPPPPPPAEKWFKVTASALNVREGPGTEFPSIGAFFRNDVVKRLEISADGNWFKVKRSYDDLTGWCSQAYLVETVAPPPPQEETTTYVQVTASTLNVREGPGTNFKSLGFVQKNEVLVELETSSDGGWKKIERVDGFGGWASNQYLTSLGKNPLQITQKLFSGITYVRKYQPLPNRLVSHALVIDLKGGTYEFLVTPPLRDKEPFLCTRTTSSFLEKNKLHFAINADGFYYLDPNTYPPSQFCGDGGEPIKLIGLAASRGKQYAKKAPGRPILYINQKNMVTFDKPQGAVFNAITGDRYLVTKGKKAAGLESTSQDPRTAVGLNQNGRYLVFVVVDGREFSEGATFPELADILLSYGVYTGISLDGGGSSAMITKGANGKARAINKLMNDNIPGNERQVANHLGLFVKK